jgi:hypothetical protein
MKEPKRLIPRDISTEDEGLQELRDRLAVSRAAEETVVSDSTLDHLREREEARTDHEERMHWRWMGKVVRNLLLWIAAVGSFLMVLVDMLLHFLEGRR